ncbi:MgtC/SapB family protein [Cohnella yongneupensis]|uniref:MgtC/SapB family protein n=1 Tax=Cohnella yongneupensis TaxID=425006 RepID=A0ABW0R305_9BACL
MHDPWIIGNEHLAIRLLLSVLLGGLVGIERERKNHAAGLRTHVLVCLGSCLIILLSMYGFAAFADEPNVRLDPARLAAQVITGVGFLGAGTILFTGKSITGLTTAASVWVVMAIGLAVGAGFYMPAVLTAVLVLLILWGLNIVEKRYVRHRRECAITVTADARAQLVESLQKLLTERGAKLTQVQFLELDSSADTNLPLQRIHMIIMLPYRDQLIVVADQFRRLEGVKSVTAE